MGNTSEPKSDEKEKTENKASKPLEKNKPGKSNVSDTNQDSSNERKKTGGGGRRKEDSAGEDIFKCKECQEKFGSFDELLGHCSEEHYKEKCQEFSDQWINTKGQCTECSKDPERMKTFEKVTDPIGHVGQGHQKVMEFLPEDYRQTYMAMKQLFELKYDGKQKRKSNKAPKNQNKETPAPSKPNDHY